jgi:hypothetical protein
MSETVCTLSTVLLSAANSDIIYFNFHLKKERVVSAHFSGNIRTQSSKSSKNLLNKFNHIKKIGRR